MIREFHNISLSRRNSFGVEQTARRLIEFDSEEDLKEIFAMGTPSKWMVLSGGNNILFTQDYDGLLLTPAACGIRIAEDAGERVRVWVDAGVEWDDLVEWAVARDLWGLENLSLIPGKAGAAPVQNIGAYGAEAAQVIRRVRVFLTDECRTTEIEAAACGFGYRESIFKHELRGRTVITSVEIELHRTPSPHLDYGDVRREVELAGGVTLRNIRNAICKIRREKLPDPQQTGNAGSFFKNPIVDRETAERLRGEFPDMPVYPTSCEERVKLAAGWLIDRAGLKGHCEGHVGIHPRQALVLINRGGASGGEVIRFARFVQSQVKARFGIGIDTEVNIV